MHGSMITDQHNWGKQNTIADSQSRIYTDNSNWKLCPQIFQGLQKMLPLIEVELFADWLNHQVPRFWSWRLDPLAEGVVALTVVWREIRTYTFPPFKLIHRMLWKVHNNFASGSSGVVPTTLVSHIAEDADRAIDADTFFTSPPNRSWWVPTSPMCLNQRLVLAAWLVSGDQEKVLNFLQTQEIWSPKLKAQVPLKAINLAGRNSLAGVVNGRRILFLAMWNSIL